MSGDEEKLSVELLKTKQNVCLAAGARHGAEGGSGRNNEGGAHIAAETGH